MLQPLKNKILEANPFDLGENSNCTRCGKRLCLCLFRRERETLGLADVLLAITKNYTIDENKRWVFFGNEKQDVLMTCANWNLRNDDLEKQSPGTIKFLTKLLL